MNRPEQDEADKINRWLKLQEYDFKGEPIFRLVWSDDQFEMREGQYNEFKGKLFVRTIYGVKQTPKYPYLKEVWILEQHFDESRVWTNEVKNHSGYECIYAFRNSKTFKRLPLRLVVVELILRAKREAISSMRRKSILMQQIEDKEDKMDKFTYDAIDPSSPIESALHFREGISLSGLDIPGDKKNAESK